MAAGQAGHVQPEVGVLGHLEGELVVLRVALADEHLEAVHAHAAERRALAILPLRGLIVHPPGLLLRPCRRTLRLSRRRGFQRKRGVPLHGHLAPGPGLPLPLQFGLQLGHPAKPPLRLLCHREPGLGCLLSVHPLGQNHPRPIQQERLPGDALQVVELRRDPLSLDLQGQRGPVAAPVPRQGLAEPLHPGGFRLAFPGHRSPRRQEHQGLGPGPRPRQMPVQQAAFPLQHLGDLAPQGRLQVRAPPLTPAQEGWWILHRRRRCRREG